MSNIAAAYRPGPSVVPRREIRQHTVRLTTVLAALLACVAISKASSEADRTVAQESHSVVAKLPRKDTETPRPISINVDDVSILEGLPRIFRAAGVRWRITPGAAGALYGKRCGLHVEKADLTDLLNELLMTGHHSEFSVQVKQGVYVIGMPLISVDMKNVSLSQALSEVESWSHGLDYIYLHNFGVADRVTISAVQEPTDEVLTRLINSLPELNIRQEWHSGVWIARTNVSRAAPAALHNMVASFSFNNRPLALATSAMFYACRQNYITQVTLAGEVFVGGKDYSIAAAQYALLGAATPPLSFVSGSGGPNNVFSVFAQGKDEGDFGLPLPRPEEGHNH